jgi:hypothetical protein
MSVKFQHYASIQSGRFPDFGSDAVAKTPLTQGRAASPSKQQGPNCNRSLQELVWVLIPILLCLYLATSYVYWAKIESAWPIFR